MNKLEQKLAAIRADSNSKAFILADARDADMVWGVDAPGQEYVASGSPERFLSMTKFREQIREIVSSGYIDMLLASNAVLSDLAHREKLFENSDVAPAVRINDTTDIWTTRCSDFRHHPSRPFATAYIHEAQYGSLTAPATGTPAVNLGLYSLTFNNDLDADYQSLEAFKSFRQEAAEKEFDYFLEVFAPNLPDCALSPQEIPVFMNDSLIRALAGIAKPHWPKFLKIPYFGPQAIQELVNFDSDLIVGILGGGSGTTYDAFKQLTEAKKYGARVALYGRKIKNAEHPLTMVKYLRLLSDGEILAEEAVKAYHSDLKQMGLTPRLSLAADLKITSPSLNYASGQ
ncbi:MAG: hypothetical protein JKX85_10415 [Phycisphaeraceae bacterium]|nr:hypothetical protein [Phycisphaeraceae bacterium]